MKNNRRRRSGKPRVSPSLMERINPNAAGIDCGSAEHYVSVPPDRDPRAGPVVFDIYRRFDSFGGLAGRMPPRITSVAMEATGVYWDSPSSRFWKRAALKSYWLTPAI